MAWVDAPCRLVANTLSSSIPDALCGMMSLRTLDFASSRLSESQGKVDAVIGQCLV